MVLKIKRTWKYAIIYAPSLVCLCLYWTVLSSSPISDDISATSVSTAVSKHLRFWSPWSLSNKSLHSKKLSHHRYLVLEVYFYINHRNYVRPCSHYVKFCLLCKIICRQETISSENNLFFTYQNFLRCHQISKMPSRRFDRCWQARVIDVHAIMLYSEDRVEITMGTLRTKKSNTRLTQ